MGHAHIDVTMEVYNHIGELTRIEKEIARLDSMALNAWHHKKKNWCQIGVKTEKITISKEIRYSKPLILKGLQKNSKNISTHLLYLLLNLVLYGCTYGLQGWNVSIQSSLHYASSIYNLTFLQMFFISVILNIFGIVALTTITLFLSAQMSSPVTALITSCVICFLPVVFDFNDSLPVLQKMQEICPIFMLHTNGIFSDMKTYFGMSQPVFMIILNVGLIFVFYRLTKNISKKHQVTG